MEHTSLVDKIIPSSSLFNHSSRLVNLVLSIFKDPSVDEILFNSVHSLLIHKNFSQVQEASSIYESEEDLIEDMQFFSYSMGIRLDPCCPINGGIINVEGLDIRWHFVLPAVSVTGPLLSFRRHRFYELDIHSFIDKTENKQRLDLCPEKILSSIFFNKEPLIICGATGTGKTSLMLSCLKEYLKNSRVVIVEKLRELPVCSKSWIHLVEKAPNIDGYGAYKIETIFKEVLRLRPDNIVVGEIRDQEEIQVFLDALQSGHEGVYTTIHAGSYTQLESRFQKLVKKQDLKEVFGDTSINVCIMNPDRRCKIKEIYKFCQTGWKKLY